MDPLNNNQVDNTQNNPRGQLLYPHGFYDVKEFCPSSFIIGSYGTSYNFTGQPLPGYASEEAGPRVVLEQATVKALSQARNAFREKGFELVLYDGYRPQKAVDFFKIWAEQPETGLQKPFFYPRIHKKDFFELGYLARRSSHSRGGAIDLSLIPLNQKPYPPIPELRQFSDGYAYWYANDGTLDMGTSFDFLDDGSHILSPLVSSEHRQNRLLLKEVMEAHGFEGYSKEWWHFKFSQETYPNTFFDFSL